MAMKLFVRLALFAAVLGAAADALAQREMTREEYIATYAPLAIQQQKEYGIPASIKIAQGIIESRYGNSDLSRRSNNHFGIKCKNNWIGDTVRYDDHRGFLPRPLRVPEEQPAVREIVPARPEGL